MPLTLSHANALRLASISTGRVTRLNKVVRANNTIPKNKSAGNTVMVNIPASSIHCTHFEAILTIGTRAERICKKACQILKLISKSPVK